LSNLIPEKSKSIQKIPDIFDISGFSKSLEKLQIYFVSTYSKQINILIHINNFFNSICYHLAIKLEIYYLQNNYLFT
jgi:hypothetical protein